MTTVASVLPLHPSPEFAAELDEFAAMSDADVIAWCRDRGLEMQQRWWILALIREWRDANTD